MNESTPHLEPLRLSVVVVAFSGGEHPRRCLAALAAQRLPPHARLQAILAHDDRLLGDVDALRRTLPGVQLVHVAGSPSPARLRAAGIAAAHGRLVALTEDHCEPDAEWLAALVTAHEGPDALAGRGGSGTEGGREGEGRRGVAITRPIAGGAIDKREPDDAVGWALYFTEFSRYMRPLPAGPSPEASDCNVSYAREALDRLGDVGREEFHQTEVHHALRGHGMAPWLDPAPLVRQGRSLPPGAAARERFAHGRLFAALRAAHLGRPRAIGLAPLALLLPFVFALRVARRMFGARRYRAPFVRALPAFLLVAFAWAAGECAGYLTGRTDE